jgi:hypothetical protein
MLNFICKKQTLGGVSMNDNQIYFNIKDNKVKLAFKDKSLNIADLIQVISTGILCAMQSIVSSAPEAERQQVKEELYDMYNAAASNTLSYFAPDIEMRPHLTAQAILDAEDAIINKEYNHAKVDPNYHSPISDKPKIIRIK